MVTILCQSYGIYLMIEHFEPSFGMSTNSVGHMIKLFNRSYGLYLMIELFKPSYGLYLMIEHFKRSYGL